MKSMPKRNFGIFEEPIFWKDQWEVKSKKYLKGKPLLGYEIEKLISKNILLNINTICEIASGSARDSLYLGKIFSVTATDKFTTGFKYAEEIAKKNGSNVSFKQEDALKLSFPDNSFDLVFHNGFFILFSDNIKIIALLKEQIRISKKYVMIVVHNKWDFYGRLRIKHFAKKGDSLFEFRWWSLKEIKKLIKPFGKITASGGLEVRIIEEIRTYRNTPRIIKKMKLWSWKGWKNILPCERIYVILEKSP